jgi:hypothetical protein
MEGEDNRGDIVMDSLNVDKYMPTDSSVDD